MNQFTAATNWLLSQADMTTTLKLADLYMQNAKAMDGKVILPDEHKPLAPIVSKFVRDLDGYVRYIRDLRDNEPRGERHSQLDDAFNMFEVRRQAQIRRDRERRLVAAFEKKFGPFPSYAARVAYINREGQNWVAGRRNALAAAKKRKKGALTSDERAYEAEVYWQTIDEAIAAGRIPRL